MQGRIRHPGQPRRLWIETIIRLAASHCRKANEKLTKPEVGCIVDRRDSCLVDDGSVYFVQSRQEVGRVWHKFAHEASNVALDDVAQVTILDNSE